jgi:RHS repeat-associated protein
VKRILGPWGPAVALCAVGSLLASGVPTVVAHAAGPSATAATADRGWSARAEVPGVETVGAIAVVRASGQALAQMPPSLAVVPGGSVVNPVSPYVSAAAVKSLPSVEVRLYDLSAGADITLPTGFLWQGTLSNGWGRITETLRIGRNYALVGKDPTGEWKLLGTFSVSASGVRNGPVAQAGGVTVSIPTGDVQWQWQSPTLPSPTGPVGVGLSWTPRTTTKPGVPSGWRLEPIGASQWATLQTFTGSTRSAVRAEPDQPTECDAVTPSTAPSLVVLRGWNGASITFARSGSSVYQQMAGGLRVPGYGNMLTPCTRTDARGNLVISSWRFIDADGTTTVFRDGRASAVYAGDALRSRLTWSDGRLASIEAITGRSISLDYAGSGSCPSTGWGSGFSAPAAGMLCRITYPDGTATDIGYQAVGSASQIALLKDPGNQGTTLGWDSLGRLAATRSALVNLAATRDPAAGGAVTTISYDANTGRVDRLVGAPATVDGPRVTQRLVMADVTESILKSRRDVQARNETTSTGLKGSISYTLDPVNFAERSTVDAAGMTTKRVADPDTGQITATTDSLGRRTDITADATGALVKQAGPYVPNPTARDRQGAEQKIEYDETYAGAGDKGDALEGFRAEIFGKPNFLGNVVESEFWRRARDASGMSQSWNRSEVFSARLGALWTPDAKDDKIASADDTGTGWTFKAEVSARTAISLIVGPFECRVEELVSRDGCRVNGLAEGVKQVTVELRTAPARGFFTISAAPTGSEPKAIPAGQVVPGYQRVTRVASNDSYPGASRQPATVLAYADPAQDQATQVTQPGGLVSRVKYESDTPATGEFGRALSYTSPGGLTRTSNYWPVSGSAEAPSLCPNARAVASGQLKTRTIQNGTSVTSYYDVMGRLVAQVTTGQAGATETRCLVYSPAGSVAETSTFGSDGKLIERSVTEEAVDGDPLVSRLTLQHGPAAPVQPDSSVTSATTVNLHGMPTIYVDEAGTTTRTSYTPLDDVETVTVTPAGATQPALTTTSTYRESDGALTQVSVNGKVAAKITYLRDTGRITRIDYGSGFGSAELTYTDTGRPSKIAFMAGNPVARMSQEVTYTQFGRATRSKTSVSVPGSAAVTDERDYVYDAARRLTQATISTNTMRQTLGYAFAPSQEAACGSAYPRASADALRTGGTRNGVAYTTCYDGQGRLSSTSDPQVTGDASGKERAEFAYDAFGRVTAISGGSRPVTMTWGSDTTLAKLVDGVGPDAVRTTMSAYGGRVVDKFVTSDAGQQRVRYGYTGGTDTSPTVVYVVQDDTRIAPLTYEFSLPGGANVTVPANGVATMTPSGIDGSALGTVAAPFLSLASSTSQDPAQAVGPAPRFGPYGEPLAKVVPAVNPALPDYGWQAAGRSETLGGTSSITLAGARPYLPGTGTFLAPDPRANSADNLYSYTPGDPINGSDGNGEANGWSWFFEILGAALVVASFVVGAASGGLLIPMAMGMAASGLSMVAMKMQTEASPALDTFRTIMFWGQMAATVTMLGATGLASFTKWGASSKTVRFLAGMGTKPQQAAGSSARAAAGASIRSVNEAMFDISAQQIVQASKWSRFTSWVKLASPFNPAWQQMGGTRSYLMSLGKLSGKWGSVAGAYKFQTWATEWVPESWKQAMESQQQGAPA